MTRAEAYEALFQLKHTKGIDVAEPVSDLMKHRNVTSYVIKFIEQNSTRTLDDFITVIAKSKKFFQNICYNYSENTSDYVRAFLSLLVHIRITLDKNPELRGEICRIFDIEYITKVCQINITSGDNEEEVKELAKHLKDTLLAE